MQMMIQGKLHGQTQICELCDLDWNNYWGKGRKKRFEFFLQVMNIVFMDCCFKIHNKNIYSEFFREMYFQEQKCVYTEILN